jgi:hypothetical protein
MMAHQFELIKAWIEELEAANTACKNTNHIKESSYRQAGPLVLKKDRY